MSDFDPDPDRLAQQMVAWVSASAAQLRRVISDIVGLRRGLRGQP